ncbi:MAG TPA: hypothetical protein VMU47_04390 [Caldimonas sp.]|nr:hypothetical protein [Caldimonas sp.]
MLFVLAALSGVGAEPPLSLEPPAAAQGFDRRDATVAAVGFVLLAVAAFGRA